VFPYDLSGGSVRSSDLRNSFSECSIMTKVHTRFGGLDVRLTQDASSARLIPTDRVDACRALLNCVSCRQLRECGVTL